MMNFLSLALPPPLDWLSLGLIAGPVGLILMGLGLVVLGQDADRDADLDAF